MSVHIIKAEKWVPVNAIKMQVTKIHDNIINCRIYGVMTINGELMQYDMFPDNADFSIGGKGTIAIATTESFKIEQKIMIK